MLYVKLHISTICKMTANQYLKCHSNIEMYPLKHLAMDTFQKYLDAGTDIFEFNKICIQIQIWIQLKQKHPDTFGPFWLIYLHFFAEFAHHSTRMRVIWNC